MVLAVGLAGWVERLALADQTALVERVGALVAFVGVDRPSITDRTVRAIAAGSSPQSTNCSLRSPWWIQKSGIAKRVTNRVSRP